MQPSEKIQKYCNDVCEQIRWKRAKPVVAVEIENHLCDQRDDYISNGDEETIATEKAILQMGDAITVGQQLDKTHKPTPQWFMIALTGLLMLIGLFANYYISLSDNAHQTFSVLAYVIAFGVLVCCYFIDFTILGKYAKTVYFLVLIISVIAIMSGSVVSGRLFLYVGQLRASLTYLSLIFPVAFALFVYSMRNKGLRGILMSGVAYLPFAAILLAVPTISGFMLYTIIALVILCLAICRGLFSVNKMQGLLIVLIPTAIVAFSVIIRIAGTLAEYFNTILNPYELLSGKGYIFYLIRQVLSEAVFFGNGGIPQNIEGISLLSRVLGYELVYLIHKFGYVILLCITLFIIIFSVIGIRKALKQKSALGSVIALTIISTFILQSVCYIIDNLGYGLVSSLALPFISAGNSALLINAALVGFMLSVFRTGEIFVEPSFLTTASKGNRSIFSYENGKIIIDIKGNRNQL